MAAVLNRETFEHIPLANTPDYPVADWVGGVNLDGTKSTPLDLSPVAGEPVKYWVLTGDVLSVMDQAAQDAVDAAEALAASAAVEAANTAMSGATRIVTTTPDADSLPVPPPKRGLMVCVDDVGGGVEGIAISTAGGWMLFAKTGEV